MLYRTLLLLHIGFGFTALLAAFGAVGLLGYGGWLLRTDDGNGVTMLVFGGFAAVICSRDLRTLWNGGARGNERILAPVTAMLGGTIATLTAFLVVNFRTDPVWLLWIAPTFVLVPVILYWRQKVHSGRATASIPSKS